MLWKRVYIEKRRMLRNGLFLARVALFRAEVDAELVVAEILHRQNRVRLGVPANASPVTRSVGASNTSAAVTESESSFDMASPMARLAPSIR